LAEFMFLLLLLLSYKKVNTIYLRIKRLSALYQIAGICYGTIVKEWKLFSFMEIPYY